jgi:hypothetical protein
VAEAATCEGTGYGARSGCEVSVEEQDAVAERGEEEGRDGGG